MYSVYAGTQKSDKSLMHQADTEDQSDIYALSGKVVETMNSGGYTYICIEKDGKKTWAAVLETKVNVGQDISLQPGYEMVNFTSNTLNRTFDKIVFSTGLAAGTAGHGTTETKSFHGKTMGGKDTEVSATEKIQVEKATGLNAYTIADLYEKRNELDKKSVSVRGKVVKVSSGIMARNWLHIQDGTGTQKDGNNDIVVTSKDLPAVGDIVTADGTLYKDKDFGSGYKYDVIVEEASVKK